MLAPGQCGPRRLAGVDGAIVQNERDGFERHSPLEAMAAVKLFGQGNEIGAASGWRSHAGNLAADEIGRCHPGNLSALPALQPARISNPVAIKVMRQSFDAQCQLAKGGGGTAALIPRLGMQAVLRVPGIENIHLKLGNLAIGFG